MIEFAVMSVKVKSNARRKKYYRVSSNKALFLGFSKIDVLRLFTRGSLLEGNGCSAALGGAGGRGDREAGCSLNRAGCTSSKTNHLRVSRLPRNINATTTFLSDWVALLG